MHIHKEEEHDWGQFGSLAPFYDELMRVVPYEDWVEYVRLLWSLHEFSPRTVLDAACGTGNVSLELARHGYEVTGVDLSADMIAVAEKKLSEDFHKTLPVRFMVGNLTSFDLGQKFDGATCLYDSLNYIIDPHALEKAFERMADHVQAGGLWVFDMNSDWAFRADLFTQSQRSRHARLHYDWKAHFDAETYLCTVQMRFEKRDATGQTQVFQETHRERAYLLPEIEAMLARTGWTLLRSYDAYTLNRPHDRSERWYFVARRKEKE